MNNTTRSTFQKQHTERSVYVATPPKWWKDRDITGEQNSSLPLHVHETTIDDAVLCHYPWYAAEDHWPD